MIVRNCGNFRNCCDVGNGNSELDPEIEHSNEKVRLWEITGIVESSKDEHFAGEW